jgi:hypothetical protein
VPVTASPSETRGTVKENVCELFGFVRSVLGSGSAGSALFLGLLDPDPLVRGMDPDPAKTENDVPLGKL